MYKGVSFLRMLRTRKLEHLSSLIGLMGAILVMHGCSGGKNTENTGSEQHVLAVSINRPSQLTYFSSTLNVLGDCSEAGRDVVISGTGGVTATTSCSTSNDYATILDFSAVDDGNITITANHSDSSGNAATPVSVTVRKDSVPALVSILSPAANGRINQENQANIAINGTCSENGQDVLVAAAGGVSSTVPCANGTWSTTLNLTNAADGFVGITADHTDAAGNAAVQATVVLEKDATPPEAITITAPVAGSYINHSNFHALRVAGDCSENGTSNVILLVGSSPIGSPLNCSSGKFSGDFDFSSQSDGSISLKAAHVDSFGNSRVSAAVVISKDVTVPAAVAIVTPIDGTYVNQANQAAFEISGSCSENGVANVLIQIDGTTNGSPLSCVNGSFSRSVDLSALAEGSLSMVAVLSDVAGNSQTSTLVHLTKDTQPPTEVSLSVPAPGAFINAKNQANYFVSGSCSENGNQNVRVYGNSTLAGVISCSDGSFSGAVNFNSVNSGSVSVTAVLFDEAGNSVTSASISTIKDVVIPEVQILKPLAGSYLNKDTQKFVEISGNCSEEGDANVVIRAGGIVLGDPLNCHAGHFMSSYDLTTQGEGEITLVAAQVDLAGNDGVSNPIVVIKDTQAPVVSITAPLNGGYINLEYQSKFTIAGNCSDNGSKNVVIKADSEVVGQPLDCVSGQFSGNFDLSSKSEGLITLAATHTDLAQNVGISEPIQVTKDTIPPTAAAITQLADNRFINYEKHQAFAVSGTCSEDGVSNVVIRVGVIDAGSAVDCVAGKFSGSFNFSAVPEGSVALKAYLFDVAGNFVASSATELIKDTVLPSVSISNSVAGSAINSLNQTKFDVTGQCSENGIANVQIKSQGVLLGDPVDCKNHEFTVTYDFSSYADGSVPLTVSQTDEASNSFTSEPVILVKDTVGPNFVIIQGPLADSYINESNQSSLTVFGICSEEGTKNVALKVGERLVGDRINCRGGEFSGQFDLSLESDGSLSLSVVHWDTAGNDLTSNPVEVIKDTQPPSLARINVPVTGFYISGSNYHKIRVSGECSEDGTDNVVLFSNDQYLKTLSCQSSAFSDDIDFTEIADGNISLRIHHLDSAGNVKSSDPVAIIKDTVVPELITISNSGRNLYISSLNQSSFAVYGICSDDGTNNVIIKKDSVPIGAPLNCVDNEFKTLFDFSSEQEGSYVFTVEHSDAAGNKAESSPVTITKDITPPTLVTIVEPTPGSYVNISNQTEFAVSGACSDDGVDAIVIKVGDTEIGDPIACEGGNYHGKFNLSAKLDGLLALTVVHKDVAGNLITSDPVEISKDTEAPSVVTINEPLDGIYLSHSASSSVRISGICSHEVPTSSITVMVGSEILGSPLACDNGHFEHIFDLSVFDDGPITLTAVHTDSAGNYLKSNPVTVTKDSVPPAFVVITHPINGSYINLANQSSLIISGTCSDDGTRNLVIKSGSKVVGESLDCIAGEFSGSINLTQEGEGEVSLSATLRDLAGNELTSEPVLLTKDIQPPVTVRIDVPLPETYINAKYKNTFTVSGECSEDGFENVVVKAGSTTVGNPVSCDGGRFTGEFDFASQSEGSVHLIAVLSDAAGNLLNSDPVVVVKDTIAPQIVTIDIPAGNSYVNDVSQASVSVSGACSEFTPNNTVVIQAGDIALGPSVSCENGKYTALIDLSAQSEGAISLTALHSDAAGNTSSSTPAVIIKDITAPSAIAVTTPIAGDYVNSDQQKLFEIKGTCSEEGVDNVTVKIGSDAIGDPLNCKNGEFSGKFDLSHFGEINLDVKAVLFDLAGNSLISETVTIIKDTVSPRAAAFTLPNQGAYINYENQSLFPVAGVCTSEDGTKNVGIESENKSIGDRLICENGEFHATINFSSENEGTLHLIAVAYDAAGNHISSAPIEVIKDTVAPSQIAINTPVSNSYINAAIQGKVKISGSCSEDGANNVVVQVGAAPVQSVLIPVEESMGCVGGSFTGTFDLSGQSEGALVLSAVLSDAAGNTRTSDVIEVIKDTQKPTSIVISTPIAGSYINNYEQPHVMISGECSDTGLGNTVVIKVNSTVVGDPVSCKTGHFEGEFNLSAFDDGLLSLRAEHGDVAGNVAVSDLVVVSKDTEAPEFVIITTPTENFYINGTTQNPFAVSGFCSTSESGNRVVIKAGSTTLGDPLICSGGEFSAEFNATLLPDGPLDLVAQHFDAAGNLLESAAVHIIKDVQPPSLIAITTPISGAYINDKYKDKFVISGTCSESELNNTVLIKANGSFVGSPQTCSGGKFSGLYDLSGFNDGSIELMAVHSDAAGNILNSNLIVIEKDIVAPDMVSIAVPVADSYVNSTHVKPFAVSGICSDDKPNNRIVINVNSTPDEALMVCSNGVFSGSIDLSLISQGLVTLTATYFDAAGNKVVSDPVYVTKDTEAPEYVWITAPLQDAIVNASGQSNLAIEGSCSEVEFGNKIVIKAGSNVITDQLTCENRRFGGVFDISGLSDGLISLTAEHLDKAGNVTVSIPVVINKDTQAPGSIAITTPAAGSYINYDHQSPVRVAGTCDDVGPGNTIVMRAGSIVLGNPMTCSNGQFGGDFNFIALDDGDISLTAELTDASGNKLTSAPVVVIKDTLAPDFVVINAPLNHSYVSYNGQIVHISGNCSENEPNNKVLIMAGSVQLGDALACTDGEFGHDFDMSSLSDGEIILTAVHTDAAGNPQVSPSVSITKDTNAPTAVAITNHVNGDYINGEDQVHFYIAGTCSEVTTGNTIVIKANATPLGVPLVCAGGLFGEYYDLSFIIDQSVVLTAEHADAAGNVTISSPISLIKDIEAPASVVITTPVAGAYINSSQQTVVEISGTCSENEPINTVVIMAGSSQVGDPLTCKDGKFGHIFNLSGQNDGDVSLTAVHSDAAGNKTTSEVVVINKDTLAPDFIIVSTPVEGSYVGTSHLHVLVSGVCSDTSLHNTVIIKANGSSLGDPQSCVGGEFGVDVNLADFDDGTITLSADHTDPAGNITHSNTVSVIKDTEAPGFVALETPITNSYINNKQQDSIRISGTCADVGSNNKVVIKANSEVFGESITCVSGVFEGRFDFRGFAEIPITLTADYSDAAGNIVTSLPVHVTKDTTPPELVTLDRPIADSYVNSINQELFEVSGTCSEKGTANVVVMVGEHPAVGDPLNCTETGFLGKVNLTSEMNGLLTLSVVHTDAAGNPLTSSSVTVNKDAELPTSVSITTPAPSSYINYEHQSKVYIGGICSESELNNKVVVKVEDVTVGDPLTCSGSEFGGQFDLSQFADGSLHLSAVHTDAAGNPLTSDTVTVLKDTESPAFVELDPLLATKVVSSKYNNPLQISGTCSETQSSNTVVIKVGSASLGAPLTCVDGTFSGSFVMSDLSEGNLVLTAEHSDAAGNVLISSSVIVKKDTLPPVAVSISNPIGGDVINADHLKLTVAGSCSENELNNQIIIKADSVSLGNMTACSDGSFAQEVDLSGLSEGLISLTVEHSDAAGNILISDPVIIKKDSAPPTLVKINTPTAGSYVNADQQGAVVISGECSENSTGNSIVIKAGAAQLGDPLVCENGMFGGTFSFASLGNGDISLTAEHFDAAGNKLVSDPVVIKKDTEAPASVAIEVPASGGYINSETAKGFIISGTCTENEPNNNVIIKAGGLALGAPLTCVSSSFSGTFVLTELPDGPISLTAEHMDAAGNVVISASVNLEKDTEAPLLVVLNAPLNGSYINNSDQGAVSVSGICTENGEENVTIQVGATQIGNKLNCVHGEFGGNFDFSLQPELPLTLTASLSDRAGNVLVSEAIIVTKDVHAPTVSLEVDNTFVNIANKNIFPVSGTCSDPGTDRVVIMKPDETVLSVTDCKNDNHYSVNLDLSDTTILAEGASLSLVAKHTDPAGNANTTDPVSVTKDTIPPTVTLETVTAYVNTLNQDKFPVAGDCSSEGSENVKIYNSQNALFGTFNCGSDHRYSGTIDLTSLADKVTDALTAKHTEQSRNSGSSAPVSITKDIELPAVSLQTEGDYVNSLNQDNFTVSGSCSDEGTNNVKIFDLGQTLLGTTDCRSDHGFSIDFDLTSMPEGSTYTLTAQHTDAAGNKSISSEKVISKDTGLPIITLESVSTYVNSINSEVFTFSGDCSEPGSENINIIKLPSTVLKKASCLVNGRFTAELNLTDNSVMPEGAVYQFVAQHLDAAGNPKVSNELVITKDTELPTISFSVESPYVIASNMNNFTLTGSCSDPGNNNVKILNGDQSLLGTFNCKSDYTFTGDLNLTDMPESSTYELTAEHADAAGNKQLSAPVSITKDSVLPTLTLSLATTYVHSQNMSKFLFSGECSEQNRDVRIINSAHTTLKTITCGNDQKYSGDLDFTTMSENATDSLAAVTTDLAGNEASSVVYEIRKDTTLPTITLTSTSSYVNIGNQGIIALSGTCSDSGDSNIKIYNEANNLLATFNCGSNNLYGGDLDLSPSEKMAEGATFALRAEHTDAASNKNTSAPVSVTKDMVAPTVSFETDGSYVNSKNVAAFAFSGECSDPGPDRVKIFTENNTLLTTFSCGQDFKFAGTLDMSTIMEEGATYLVRAEHTDASGNMTASTPPKSIKKDTLNPTVTLVTTTQSVNFDNQGVFAVSGSCSEVDSPNVQILNADNVVLGTLSCDFSNHYEGTLDLSSEAVMAEGAIFVIRAEHADLAGNKASSDSQTISKDTTKPTVTLIAESGYVNFQNNATFTFSGNCSDTGTNNVKIYTTDEKLLGTESCDVSGHYSIDIDFSSESVMPEAATYVVIARHTDAAQNLVVSDAVMITKDTTKPTITLAVENPYVNSTNEANFPVMGTCSDSGAANVKIYNSENTLLGTFDCQSDNTFTGELVLTTMFENAVYVLMAEHTDPATNKSISSSVTITKDTVAPYVTLEVASSYVNHSNQNLFPVSGDCNNGVSTVKIINDAEVVLGTLICGPNHRYEGGINLSNPALMPEQATFQISAVYSDEAGNIMPSTSYPITKDTVLPTATLAAEGEYVNFLNQSVFHLSGDCSDSGASNVKIYTSTGVLLKSMNCKSDLKIDDTLDLSNLEILPEDGSLTFNAEITDSAGNASTSNSITVKKDTVLPTVTLAAESSYVNISNVDNFTLSGTCSEIGNDVKIYNDANTLLKTFNCGSNNQYSGDIDFTLAEVMSQSATFILRAEHSDLALNKKTSTTVSITKDTVGPTLTLDAQGSYVNLANQESFTVSGDCSDEGTANVKIYSDTNALLGALNCGSNNRYSGGLDLRSLDVMAEGATLILTANMIDPAGNSGFSSSVSIIKDTIAPTAPANVNDGIQGLKLNPPLISWDATQDNEGGSGISKYEISLASTLVSYADVLGWQNQGASATSGTLTGLTPETALTVGNTYYTSVRVTDNAGNSTISQGDGWIVQLCPANYIEVPGLSDYTSGSFCVAKYEAKPNAQSNPTVAVSVASGTPWVDVPQVSAISYCQANGTGYDLINNAEWQSIARNVESVAANWSTLDGSVVGQVGTGLINTGHSDYDPADVLEADSNDANACAGTTQTCSDAVWDTQRRTHVLSNGKIIWDLAGNVSEWVKDTNYTDYFGDSFGFVSWLLGTSTDLGTVGGINGNAKFLFGPLGDYSIADANTYFAGLGLATFSPVENNLGGIIRGFDYNNPYYAGIFAVSVGLDVGSNPGATVGFRCVYHPQ